MIGQLRQVFGLAVLAALVLGGMFLITSFSRERLTEAFADREVLLQTETQLRGRLGEVLSLENRNTSLPVANLWPGDSPAAIEIAFQTALVDAAEASDLRLVSFAPSVAPSGVSASASGYDVEVEGGHEEVARFLSTLEATVPKLSYSRLSIRQQPGRSDTFGKALVSLRIGVWAFTSVDQTVGGP